jgi:uncharacterized membrane protein YeaQ/YmgE (transglycosylase-associated protein family)
MWLPLDLVAEFLGRSVTWLAVMAGIGGTAGLLVSTGARRLRSSGTRRRLCVAGIVGAILGASIMTRFSLPDALIFEVWRRRVPLAWSAGGALLVAVATATLLGLRKAGAAPLGPGTAAGK